MFTEILDRLTTKFGPNAIAQSAADLLPKVISAILTAVIFWLLWQVLSRGLRALLAKLEIDTTLQALIEAIARYTVVIIATISVLSEVGIDTGSLIASLGVAGLTIGFAARDTLSNLISGLFIFWDRPFVIGDLIELNGQYGRVDQITLRSTRVVTVDGKMLAVPNSTVVNSTVASYTNFPNLRIDLDFTLGVEESLPRVRAIFDALIEGDERFMDTPRPNVVLKNVGDFNITAQFRVWIHDETRHVPIRFELRERIYGALLEAGVDMPFELSLIHI